jgi:hypothetical protein
MTNADDHEDANGINVLDFWTAQIRARCCARAAHLAKHVMRKCSGGFLPPSPPAKKATARQDQTGQTSTSDGPGTATCWVSEPEPKSQAADCLSKCCLAQWPNLN